MTMHAAETPHQPADGRMPRPLFIGILCMVGFTLIATAAARFGDVGTVHLPPASVVRSLDLRFVDEPDGAVAIRNARTGALIDSVAPGAGGFARSTLRGLVRERKRSGIGEDAPFVLTHRSNGTLSIDDPATGRSVPLDVFGPTNAGAFAALFEKQGSAR